MIPQEPKQFDFGTAINYLKSGHKVKRSHWGGYWFIPQTNVIIQDKPRTGYDCAALEPIIVACLKDNAGYVAATPYQEDILATDWEVIE